MKRFKNILYVMERGESCRPSLERAIALAENNQANLTVVAVSEAVSDDISLPKSVAIEKDLQAVLNRTLAEELEALVKDYRARINITTRVLTGVAFLQIIREVLRQQHDLVIKVPESQNWIDRLFGSDDMHLLRKCPCPVWLIKPQAPKAYRHILAAVDVDDAYPEDELKSRHQLNRQIVEMASSVALADFAELHLVHAWEAIGESAMRGAFMHSSEENISTYVSQVKQRHADKLQALVSEVSKGQARQGLEYLKPKTHLVKGGARKEIPALAKQLEADLIVMGTVGRTGIPGFIMGNTAETILNQIDCSVLAIKPPGFVTPVTLED